MYDFDSLSSIAAQKFTDERFVHVRDVPVFDEHETVGKDGDKKHYTKEDLERIIEKCNRRIADTDDFAALTEGHTPDKEDLIKGAKQPEVLGFSGPFKLGKIGRLKPRYAILADEWHFKDTHDKLCRLPRRSVELWLGDEPFFDPIAALGAETPRLDLGIKFLRLSSGTEVEKYFAAFPAENNTFVPGEKEKNMLAPEDIQQIILALDELPWVQAAKAQSEAPPVAPAAPPVADNGGEKFQAEDESEDYEAEENKDNETYEAGDADEKKEDYMCGHDKMQKGDSELLVKHRKLEAAYEAERVKYSQMEQRLQRMERESADAKREARIERLSRDFMIDPAEEMEKCLYSKGAKMNDESFEAHVKTIEKYARVNPVGKTLPRGDLPPVEVERNEKQEAEKAKKIVEAADKYRREHGRQPSWEQAAALAEAK